MPVLPKSSTHANQSSKFLVLAWSPQFYRVASPTSFGNVMYCNYCHLFRLASNTNKQGGKNNHQVSHTTLTFLEFLWWLPYLQRQLAWAAAACERHTAKTHSQSAWANLLTKFVAKSNTTTICMPYNMFASAKKDFRNSCVPLVSEMKATVRKRIEVTHEGSWLRPNPWGLIFHLLHDVSAVSFPS